MKNKNKSGYSLVELLIVIAIIAVMTGAVFVSMSSNSAKRDVDVASRQIAAQLRDIQNEVVSGKLAANTLPTQEFMLTSANFGTYSVQYYNGASQLQILPFSLATKVVFEDAYQVGFLPPAGRSTGISTIIIHSTKDPTKKATICVNAAGKVEEKSGAAVCS